MGLCATLSDPTLTGSGLAKFYANMWQLSLLGRYNMAHLRMQAQVGYACALGGQYRDSGVFDLLSDPFNATLGANYLCDGHAVCAAAGTAPLVPASGTVRGEAWDACANLGYSFCSKYRLQITPYMGWLYNRQRFSACDSSWGPIKLQYLPYANKDDFEGQPFYAAMAPLFGGWDANFAANIAYGVSDTSKVESSPILDSSGSIIGFELKGTGPGVWLLPQQQSACPVPCTYFGHCADASRYTANWNGPLIGLEVLYDCERWAMSVGYDWQYLFMQASFNSLDNGCNGCPQFVNWQLNDVGLADFNQCASFCPATIRWHSPGWGQKLYATLQCRCLDSLLCGLRLQYASAQGFNGGSTVTPCQSCCSIVNGRAYNPGVPEYSVTAYPYWSDALAYQNRWRSLSIQFSLAIAF